LNNAERFLRGGSGSDTATYQYQDDALQNHQHEYWDKQMDDTTWGNRFASGITDFPNGYVPDKERTSEGVKGARTSDETRPKNMKVVFIMKCWHHSQN